MYLIMKTTTPIIILFAVLLVALLWLGFLTQKASAPETESLETNTPAEQTEQNEATNDEAQPVEEEVDYGNDVNMEFPIPDDDMAGPSTGKAWADFQLEGRNFEFLQDGEEAPTLRVKLGDSVSVTLKSTEGFHDFVIDELGVASDKVSLGESTTVTFTATERGEFEYYCSVGSHRANGMFGTFIVE